MNGDCVFPNARQCTATSKRTLNRCRAPAVTGWKVCRFHGARGGRPAIHGLYSKRSIAERRDIQELLKASRETVLSALHVDVPSASGDAALEKSSASLQEVPN